MTFIVVVVAALIERFFDWSHLRKWHWFERYEQLVADRVGGKNAWVHLSLLCMPPILTVLFLNQMLAPLLFGVLQFFYQLFIVLYCFGPQNLWVDAFASMNAMQQGDASFTAEKLNHTLHIPMDAQPQSLPQYFLDHLFIEFNRRILAVLFWYALLGPAGAILYRLITKADEFSVKQDSMILASILNWLPVRLLVLAFAISGHFTAVLRECSNAFWGGFNTSLGLLTDSGKAALGLIGTEKNSDERQAIALLDRAGMTLFVMMAVMVLVI